MTSLSPTFINSSSVGGADNGAVFSYRIHYCWVLLSVTETITHLTSRVGCFASVRFCLSLPCLPSFVDKSCGLFLPASSLKSYHRKWRSPPSRCCLRIHIPIVPWDVFWRCFCFFFHSVLKSSWCSDDTGCLPSRRGGGGSACTS